MLNLLPIDEKKRLRMEYAMRLGVVVLSVLIVTLLVGVILLLPSLFLSKAKEQSYVDRALITQRSSEENEQEALREVLNEAQQKINILALGTERTSLRGVFDTILSHLVDGVEITGMFYTKTLDIVVLTIDGKADTREKLLAFSRELEDDPLFSDIELPVSNLAKDQDISFKITIQGDF